MFTLLFLLLAADTPERITKPDWVEKPSPYDLEAFYPPDARMREVEGRAVIECTVTVEGTLTDCVVISEEPADSGFGAATVKAAVKFRMKPKTVDGEPVSSGVVRIPLRWTLGAVDPELMRERLAEAEACVGYAQARVPGLRGSGKRDVARYHSWLSAYVYAATNSGLKPSEVTRQIEARRVEAAAKLAAGEAVPAACDGVPTGFPALEAR